jgi:hypothetical protein
MLRIAQLSLNMAKAIQTDQICSGERTRGMHAQIALPQNQHDQATKADVDLHALSFGLKGITGEGTTEEHTQ